MQINPNTITKKNSHHDKIRHYLNTDCEQILFTNNGYDRILLIVANTTATLGILGDEGEGFPEPQALLNHLRNHQQPTCLSYNLIILLHPQLQSPVFKYLQLRATRSASTFSYFSSYVAGYCRAARPNNDKKALANWRIAGMDGLLMAGEATRRDRQLRRAELTLT